VTAESDRPRSLGRNYWRLWTSAGLSNLADGVLSVSLPLIAIGYTQSPTLIAGLAVAVSLPWLLFALQAGAISDRYDRRRVMLAANVGRATLMALVAAAVGLDIANIWLLYVVAFFLGIAETLYDTSAQSILPQVVDRSLLPRANGRLYTIELAANEFVGPPLGGFLVAVGAALSLATSSVVWLVAAAVLLLLSGTYKTGHDRSTTIRADIGEGLRFLAHHRVLRAMAALTGLSHLGSSAMFAVFVLYAVGPDSAMGLSEPGFGVLLTSLAVGSFIGTLVAEPLDRLLGRQLTLIVMLVAGGVMLAAPAFTTNAWVIASTFVVGGATIVMGNVVMVSLRQRVTPDRLLGRVNSAYRLVAWGTMPIGALLGGLGADAFGLPTLFVSAAIVSMTPLLLTPILSNRAMDEAERDVE
jgi:MFS family permease